MGEDGPEIAVQSHSSDQVFDFSAAAQANASAQLLTKMVLGGVGALFLGFGVLAVVVPVSNYAPSNWLLTICFLAIGLAGLLSTALMKSTPALRRVIVRQNGLVLAVDGSPDESILWTNLATGITITDFSEVTQLGRRDRERVVMRWKGDRLDEITAEALERIVASADAAAVPVLVREEVESVRGTGRITPEVTRIGRPESTPGWDRATALES